MPHEGFGRGAGRFGEAAELFTALDGLSMRDRQILWRMVRRLAAIEVADGEAVALAVGERIEMVLRGSRAG